MVESRRRRPSLALLCALARGLGVSPLVLFLLAANGRDVPVGRVGIGIIAQIARLVDDLWRFRRNVRGQGRNHKE